MALSLLCVCARARLPPCQAGAQHCCAVNTLTAAVGASALLQGRWHCAARGAIASGAASAARTLARMFARTHACAPPPSPPNAAGWQQGARSGAGPHTTPRPNARPTPHAARTHCPPAPRGPQAATRLPTCRACPRALAEILRACPSSAPCTESASLRRAATPPRGAACLPASTSFPGARGAELPRRADLCSASARAPPRALLPQVPPFCHSVRTANDCPLPPIPGRSEACPTRVVTTVVWPVSPSSVGVAFLCALTLA